MKSHHDWLFSTDGDRWRSPQPARRGTVRGQGPLFLLALVMLGLLMNLATPMAGSAATTPGGAVVAWGSNRANQLGLAFSGVQRAAPGAVAQATNGDIVAIGGGRNHSAALTADGRVLTWGANSSFGELGLGTTTDRADPTQIITNASALAVALRHTLVVVNGQVYAWGDNSKQQVGNGAVDTCSSGFSCARRPVPVGNLSNVTAVGGGLWHSLAVRDDGTVWSWGSNALGQLGLKDVGQTATPGQVPDVEDIVAVSGGEGHSLALASDGTVYSWGLNTQGQLGQGKADPHSYPPQQIPGLTNIVAIASGYRHSMALQSNGIVWTWGFNATGQLGNGMVPDNGCQCTPIPMPIFGLTGVAAIAAGEHQALALKEDGTVYAWGDNGSEQLGVTGQAVVAAPRLVPGLGDVTAIGGGGTHSLAVIPTHTLTITTVGPGTVQSSPAGARHPQGARVTLTAQPTPGSGALFISWVVDGSLVGHGNPLTLTMDGPHIVYATFAVPPAFCDVTPSHPNYEAIRQLAARGIIRGYQSTNGQTCFGANDSLQRAQMAALIARAFGWDQESHPNPFTDRNGIDANLWSSVAALAHYNVTKGYSAADCAKRNVAPPCFGPLEKVTQAQVISFISRAMVAKGYWQTQPDNPAIYPGVPASSGHRADIATYVHYVGLLPGTSSTTAQWTTWSQPALRSWFAEAEWRALNDYFGTSPTP